jgi:hypothetical protein
LITDENQFFRLRTKLLTQPSIRQAITAHSIKTVTIMTENKHVQDGGDISTNTQKKKIIIEQKRDKFQKTLFIHCTHEGRFKGMKRDIHEIHDSFFKGTPNEDIRLVVGNQNNRNTDLELGGKRPPSSLLKVELEKKQP